MLLKLKKKFVDAGFGVDRNEVMYNDFVIIGKSDQQIYQEKQNRMLFKNIKEKNTKFISGETTQELIKKSWVCMGKSKQIVPEKRYLVYSNKVKE